MSVVPPLGSEADRPIHQVLNRSIYPGRTIQAGSPMSSVGGGQLRKAVLYNVTTNTSEIQTSIRKVFQFNPPTMMLGISMAPTEPDAAKDNRGNLKTSYLGTAGTSVEMLFDRSAEVASGPNSGWGEYKRLGVARDVLDVYAVLRGDASLLADPGRVGAADDGQVRNVAANPQSIREFTSTLYDLVGTGSQVILASTVALSYSPDLVLYGMVTSMDFRFLKFNHDLVPTYGYVDLTMDIYNAASSSAVSNLLATGGNSTSSQPSNTGDSNLPYVYPPAPESVGPDANGVAWGWVAQS